ncbi:uncharacterized protein pon [Chironomus tepperi]|uniref:uncharacterized protein pon n=1 Tax=Chironomus tepperi TaxID=113505 RepID=UPI00391EEF62
MINASFDAMDTPGKKRKRENFQKFVSSTPIKMNNNNNNKENFHFSESCMEVKSIAEIVAERKGSQQPANEYEVIRKPPKKKKKAAVVEECCFVNPGLDLKVDEKVINPFEVVRDDDTEAKILAMGVSNPALDIKNEPQPKPNAEISTNPFEVKRDEVEVQKNVSGIENSALDLNNPVRTALVLPLPFTPTVNHRIDFSSMPDNLTPSSLLSTKLVLENNEAKITPIGTPKKNTTAAIAGRSLSVISEEEIDIGEELDNYQLQLENSINEAKIQNKQYEFDNKSQADPEEVSPQVNSETFTKEILKTVDEATKNIGSLSGLKESDVDDENYYNDDINDDVQFEEVDSFEDVGKLGQFKRAYRTDAPAPVEFKKPTLDQPIKKPSKLGSSIRRSIRKLMHPNSKTEKNENEKSSENSEPKHDGIFQTIRQSLRRKQKPKEEVVVSLETTLVGRQVFKEATNIEPKRTLEKHTLKRNIVKTVKTFMESVEEFDHF